MDRNTITGLVIVAAILLGFSWWTSNQNKKYQEERRINDSIARAEGRLIEPALETVEPFQSDNVATATAAPTATADSIHRARLGSYLFEAQTGKQEFFTVENKVMSITFSNKGGNVVGVDLKKYNKYGGEPPLKLYADSSAYFGMTFFLGNQAVKTSDFYFKYAGTETIALPDNRSAQKVLMHLPVDSESYLEYAYTIFEDDFMVDFDVRFVNMQDLLSAQQPQLTFELGMIVPQQERGFRNENNYTSVYYHIAGENGINDIGTSTGIINEEIKGTLQWIAFKQQFFSTIFISRDNFQNAEVGFETFQPTDPNLKKFHAQTAVSFDKNKTDYGFRFYFGSNRYSTLKSYDMNLERLVPLGWPVVRQVNMWLVIPVFEWLSKHIANFGIIILILTIMIKLIILPLTYKSYLSMGKMRLLKPEIDAIAEKFPKREDALKKQQATMELYKKAGVSPMGGCIPLLIQMPVIMAMFFFFPASIELRGEPFLWATDLSTYDNVLNLPFTIPLYGSHVSLFALLMAMSLFLSTKLNPQTGMGGQQPGMKFIMYLMPVMLLVMFNNYSSGLTYYYFLANVFTIGQTWLFKIAIDDQKLHAKMKASSSKSTKTADKKKGKSKWQQKYETMMREQQKQIANKNKRR